jgi:hypothetical protein
MACIHRQPAGGCALCMWQETKARLESGRGAVLSEAYRWAECCECGASVRVPLEDPDEPLCGPCVDVLIYR